jgi:peptidoglycan/LPS O-acetylase OafA/YrhL
MTAATLSENATAQAAESEGAYHYGMGYLRAFIVMLVVAHHAALAYYPFAPPMTGSLVAQPRWWQAFPVVDPQRASWAALLVGFNDTFFMSLMFFLSGLFVRNGLKRKGSGAFLRGRLLRLGAPFVVAAALLAPVAYYPAYLQLPGQDGLSGFVRQWLALGNWPAGPAWFIWVLLVFDCIAALLFAVAPRWGEAAGRLIEARPLAVLLVISAAVYVPLELKFTGVSWAAFGPFTFQTSRVLHYLAYFLAGTAVGAWGLGQMAHGKLARRWVVWAAGAVVAFLAASAVTIGFMSSHLQSRGWEVATDLMFVLSCAVSSLAFLALFLRFAHARSSVLDGLARNSYGIYLVHYVFVNWLGLVMIGAVLPAAIKFALVVCLGVGCSWVTTIALRRVPGLAQVI